LRDFETIAPLRRRSRHFETIAPGRLAQSSQEGAIREIEFATPRAVENGIPTDFREGPENAHGRSEDVHVNPTSLPQTPALVLARESELRGVDRRALARATPDTLQRLRRGVYADSIAYAAASPDERYRAHVAAAMLTRVDAVACGMSAAALYGFPLLGEWPSTVFLLASGRSGRRRNGVIEVPRRGTETITAVGHFAATSHADTLIDVCRVAPFLTALAMVDAALKTDRYGHEAPVLTIDDLWSAYEARMPFRNCRKVRRVLEFATDRADSVLETLSRVTIFELGFPEPELQFELHLPRSAHEAFVDFGWPRHRIAGEADGWGKYVNPEYGSAVSPAERVRLEKRRDNELRGIGWTPAHWEWNDA
jgi:hypothetical protein